MRAMVEVLTVDENASVPAVAKLLAEQGVSARDRKLVGIVSRANLVRALAMTIDGRASGMADDSSIRDKLLAELKAQRWAEVPPANITVKDGVVHLWSSYLSGQEKRRSLSRLRTTPVFGASRTMRPIPPYLLS